jgi:hypothetical protein
MGGLCFFFFVIAPFSNQPILRKTRKILDKEEQIVAVLVGQPDVLKICLSIIRIVGFQSSAYLFLHRLHFLDV